MRYFYLLLMLFVVAVSSAQMDVLDSLMQGQQPKKEYVAYTFKTTRVITGHSIETVKKNSIDFRVSHRFGDMFGVNQNIHTLFGFDLATDIGIIVDYGITDDLTVGIGRMKGAGLVTELWNANIKYRVLKQTKDFKIPITVTVFGNTAISSMRPSSDPSMVNYFPSGYAGFSHRLSYVLQAMVASKINDWLSIQLSPTFLWRNIVPLGDQNALFSLGLSARAKFSKRSAIVFEYYTPLMKSGVGGREYFPMLRGIRNAAYYPALGIGLEFETGGHVFDVNLTNSAGLLENDFLAYNPHNWAQGQFRMGFTISRSFQLGQKGGKYWKKGSIEDAGPEKEKTKK